MKKQKVTRFIYRLWKEWRATIFFIVFVLVPTKSSVADWNWVPTGSMNPTILEGDLIYVNKIAYDLRFPLTLHRLAKWSNPQKGDIVVCFSPEEGTRLVKRVVGQPGDIIELRSNTLFLNGEPAGYTKIDSKYKEYLSGRLKEKCILVMEDLDGISHAVMSTPSITAIRSFGPVKIPQNSYFMMGDNRDNSKDSRYFGFVERKLIIGKAKGVITSFDITDKYQPRLKRFFASLK
ncbi:MAG: signal peptidase I [Sedimentisphaerales bacterium]|nr:signal peptidase I [Sedimentisphaerales bacterium]